MSKSLEGVHVVSDLDDVLGDFWQTVLPAMNERFGKECTKDMFTEYNKFADHYEIGFDDFTNFLVEGKLLEQIKPHNHMIEVMNHCKRNGANVTVISSRSFHPNAYKITSEWLERHKVPHDDLYITGGDVKKSDVVNRVDIVYDDHHKHLDDFVQSGVLRKLGTAVLVDQPWNRHYHCEHPVYRFDHKTLKQNVERYIK